MDPKKQDLNPELKQIYDRVMNTQVGSKPSGAESLPPGQSPLGGGGGGAPATPPPTQPHVPVQPAPAQTTPQPVVLQPISEPKSFVFTGNKIVSPQGGTHTDSNVITSKKGLSGSIIAVLVVILVIAWGSFWAKIFGLF